MIEQAYNDLHDAFQTDGTFWLLGNAFDTMLDYLRHNPSQAGGVNDLAVKQFNASRGNEAWYDDDGWWLIAGIKGVSLSGLFGWNPEVLKPHLLDTWTRFSTGAPYVWRNGKGLLNGHYAPLFPLVAGGVWNSDWAPIVPGCDPTDPNGDTLEGIQNTVTNGLFMVGSQRLTNSPIEMPIIVGQPTSAQHADNEYSFLSQWFGTPPRDAPSLLHVVGPDAVVVRERVTAYDSSQPVYGYVGDQAWLGDQGLILGGLTARIKSRQGDPDGKALAWAKQILRGVPLYLQASGSKFLSDWPASTGAPGGDNGDYSTGSGVFFRYLANAWENVPELKAFMIELGWPGIVKDNIDAPTPPPKNSDQPVPIIAATNKLSVLLADKLMHS